MRTDWHYIYIFEKLKFSLLAEKMANDLVILLGWGKKKIFGMLSCMDRNKFPPKSPSNSLD